MNCFECKGACCEEVWHPLFRRESDPRNEWLRVRGREVKNEAGQPIAVALEAPCPSLIKTGQEKGLCSIHETKPVFCETFRAGGPACLESVRSRRSLEDYIRIRDEEDPSVKDWKP